MADGVISKIKLPNGNEFNLKDSGAARSNHEHTVSLVNDTSGATSLTLEFEKNYKITAAGGEYIFTMPPNPDTDTTYTITTGDANGLIKVTPSRGGSAYNVNVAGLGSAAYTTVGAYSSASHTHTTTLGVATTADESLLSLTANTKYKLTTGGTSFIFTTPQDINNKVTLTATTTSAAYEILFSETADNTTRTEGAKKTSSLTYNPSTKALVTGGTINGYSLNAAAARSVDTSISDSSTSTNLPTAQAVASFVEGKGYITGANSTDVGLGNVSNNSNLNNANGTKGDMIYWSANNTPARLGITSTTTKKFLSNTSQTPSWVTLEKGDVGLSNVENTRLSTWSGSTNITTVGTIAGGTWNGAVISSDYIGSHNHSGANITSGTVAAARLGTMTGATTSTAGASGAVPLPAAGKNNSYLRGDATWQAPTISIAGTSVGLDGSISADTLRTNLGLSSAMHFIGIATTAIADNSTTNPAISGYDFANNKAAGDVVIDKNSAYEYVWTGSKWERLGPDGSYKTIQSAVSDPAAGNDGQLNFINTISQNEGGVISVTKLPVRTASTSLTGVIQITEGNTNAFLNTLSTGSSDPQDNDYFISLYAGGGSTTSTYHRRPVSKLYNYIKSKTDALYKPKQTAVETATADTGTTTTFVSSVTQNANGVITVTTKTLPPYNNYIHPTDDGNLHVPATGTTNNGKFLKAGSTAGSLSWGTAVTSVATGVGLTGGTITTTGTIKAKLRNETALTNDSVAVTETTNRVYPVAVDKSGYLAVNVPWTNVNGNYLTGVTTTVTGTGNAITDVSADGGTITFTKGGLFLTSHRTYTQFTGKPTGNLTPGFGSTFTIQLISLSTTGQVSGTDRTVTIPSTIAKNDTKGLIQPWYHHTVASKGITAGSDATEVTVNTISTNENRYYAVEIDSNGRLFVNVPWSNSNANYLTGVTVTGSGNAVTTASVNGLSITLTKGTTFLTSHRTYTSFTGSPTSDLTPGFGSTFTVLQISLSTTGLVSGTNYNVTIPATLATNEIKGLVQPWYSHTAASTGPTTGSNNTAVTINAISTNANRYYAIESDSNGRLFVNVPWSNVNVSYLPLSGGKMTGRIYREGVSTNWNKGRDNALVATSTLNGYSPFASIKTTNGSWDIGAYNSDSYTDDLVYSYVPDTLYNGTNTTPTQIKFLENGHIVATLDGTATSAGTATNLANKPSIATSGTTQITVTAGGKTSDPYTVPYASTAGLVAWANVNNKPTKITLTGDVTGSVDLGTGALTLATTANHTHDLYLKRDGSNNMTADVNIIAGDTDKYVNFWYNANKTAGASWRAGMQGAGSSDTNYYAIESGSSNTSSTTWSTALRFGQNTLDAGFGGNVYPITTNSKTLGTTNNKWLGVYAKEFYGNLKYNNLIPIATKSYDAYTCSEDTQAKAVLFFAKVNITDYSLWTVPWAVHYRLYVSTIEKETQGWYDCYFSINGSTVNYYNYNNFYSTSYRPIYHHALLYAKDGQSAQGAYLGMRVLSSRTVTTLARVYKIELLELINCTVTFENTLRTYDATANGTYYSYGEYNATSVGLQESGDANTNDTSLTYERYGNARLYCTTIYPRYTLSFTHPTDSTKVIPVNTTENSTANTKSTITGAEFSIFDKIYYKSSAPSTVLAANSLIAAGDLWYAYSAIDLRYSFNLTTSSFTAYKDVYLVCNLVTPTTATLRGYNLTGTNAATLGPITQTLPVDDDGYIYIKLGKAYNGYCITLMADHPIFWYKNGAVREYVNNITLPSTSTANAIVRFNGTSGNSIKNSGVTIDDNGNIVFPSTCTASLFPSHYYTRPYDTDGNTYVHYYSTGTGTTSTYSYANLRVKNDNSYKVLKFGGDGTFTWDGSNVATAANSTSGDNNGLIKIAGKNISVTGLGSAAYTESSAYSGSGHGHGNIISGGTITSTGVALANGDTLLFSDSGNSGKIERTSITFDGSTTTKALTPKGTWETFLPSLPLATTSALGGIQVGYTTTDQNYAVKLSGNNAYVNVPWTDTRVTDSGNHYTPTTANGQNKTASASGATAAWSIDVVTGITINTDGKGHITGLSVASGKLPANPNSDTLVKQTVKTDNVNYKLLGTTSSSPSSGTAMEATYSVNVYTNPSTGAVSAMRHTWNYSGSDRAYTYFNNTDNSIDFVFV